MDEIKAQFVRYLRQSERSPLTVKNYLSDINGFAKWFRQTNGDVPHPQRIRLIDLREYKQFLAH